MNMLRKSLKLKKKEKDTCTPLSGTFHLHVGVASEIECTTTEKEAHRSFSSVLCLSKDKIVIFDTVNTELILYNNEHGSFSYLQLTEPCWALEPIQHNLMVASVGSKLLFFGLESDKLLQHERQFTCHGQTKGVSFNNGYYAVVFENERKNKIALLDRKGRETAVIDTIQSQESSIDIPDEVLLDKKAKVLYLCDSRNYNLVCVSIQSEVLWIKPLDIYSAVCNPVFLYDLVLILGANGTLSVFDLLGNLLYSQRLPEDGAPRVPSCIAYDDTGMKLYVISTQQATVRAYNVVCYNKNDH